jgi:hypothetical protein
MDSLSNKEELVRAFIYQKKGISNSKSSASSGFVENQSPAPATHGFRFFEFGHLG